MSSCVCLKHLKDKVEIEFTQRHANLNVSKGHFNFSVEITFLVLVV